MKGYFDKLRPSEKRLVVGVGLLFFVVLNLVFVRPYFSDWGATQDRRFQADRKLKLYTEEIGKTNAYQKTIAVLEKEGGSSVPAEEQARHFSSAIISAAAQCGVTIVNNGRITTRTNQFFLEQSQPISVQSGESQLVDFLYNLGSGGSLIRVRDLSIRPDPPRQQLVANVKLAASYQKQLKGAAPTGATRSGRSGADARTDSPFPGPNSTAKRP
jgi:hypothetical protein